MIKYMAVAVAVAVSWGVAVPVVVPVAVPVPGLTKRFFNHPKKFLNQCLGLQEMLAAEIGLALPRRRDGVAAATPLRRRCVAAVLPWRRMMWWTGFQTRR